MILAVAHNLLALILDKGIFIRTVSLECDFSGAFNTTSYGQPTIELPFHKPGIWLDNSKPDISIKELYAIFSEDNLFILAHEYGHALSEELGLRSNEYLK